MHTYHDRSRPATPLSESILVRGDSRVSLTGPELRGLANKNRIVTVVCVSGTRHTAAWAGVPILDLSADAGLDGEMMHPLVKSADGYRICIDVHATLDAAVAYARDETPIGEEHDYEARPTVSDVDGSRTVKGVRAIEALALDPATDPESFEDIFKKP